MLESDARLQLGSQGWGSQPWVTPCFPPPRPSPTGKGPGWRRTSFKPTRAPALQRARKS